MNQRDHRYPAHQHDSPFYTNSPPRDEQFCHFRFSLILGEEDYVEFNRFHMNNAPINKKSMRLFRFLMPATVVVLTLPDLISAISEQKYHLAATIIMIWAVLFFAWFFLLPKFFKFSLKQNVKNMKKFGSLPFDNVSLVSFYDDFFIDASAETENKTKYLKIENVVIGDKAIYIYVSTIQALIIPFNIFPSNLEIQTFLNFLNQRIS